jgi:hypothetical protein
MNGFCHYFILEGDFKSARSSQRQTKKEKVVSLLVNEGTWKKLKKPKNLKMCYYKKVSVFVVLDDCHKKVQKR